MAEQQTWTEITTADPEHSARYVERFRSMAAAGQDIEGEARFIDAMAPRGAHLLDAGCGPGRVGGFLHRAGHRVVGVDLDPHMLEAAIHRRGHTLLTEMERIACDPTQPVGARIMAARTALPFLLSRQTAPSKVADGFGRDTVELIEQRRNQLAAMRTELVGSS